MMQSSRGVTRRHYVEFHHLYHSYPSGFFCILQAVKNWRYRRPGNEACNCPVYHRWSIEDSEFWYKNCELRENTMPYTSGEIVSHSLATWE